MSNLKRMLQVNVDKEVKNHEANKLDSLAM